jgi:hypothetical protein
LDSEICVVNFKSLDIACCASEAEAVTVESFYLLNEKDLAELGFKLGHRALIMSHRITRSIQRVEMMSSDGSTTPSPSSSGMVCQQLDLCKSNFLSPVKLKRFKIHVFLVL